MQQFRSAATPARKLQNFDPSFLLILFGFLFLFFFLAQLAVSFPRLQVKRHQNLPSPVPLYLPDTLFLRRRNSYIRLAEHYRCLRALFIAYSFQSTAKQLYTRNRKLILNVQQYCVAAANATPRFSHSFQLRKLENLSILVRWNKFAYLFIRVINFVGNCFIETAFSVSSFKGILKECMKIQATTM